LKNRVFVLSVAIVMVALVVMTGCSSGTQTPTTTIPPTTTITTTPPTTITTTPPTTTTGGPPVLDIAAKPIDPTTHPDAYSTLCLTCHGPGVGAEQFPLPPTWAGTDLTPGPWTIIPGSTQDHTGLTDVSKCISEGCHQMGQ
jgi:ABC-type transport system substrate-binding protein